MPSLVERFLALFDGYEKAYGTYIVKRTAADGKAEGRAETIRGALTLDVMRGHLTGEGPGVGGIALKDDNTAKWGAIDLDIRGRTKLRHELPALEAMVKHMGLPLVTCRSKSGGAHLYLFLTTPAPATMVVDTLTDWASRLGYGGCEVFPKQTSRANEDDIGNWINLPYFHAKRTTRYGVLNGEAINLEEFLNLAENTALTPEALDDFEPVQDDSGMFADGPPCLQILHRNGGFPQGSRNEGLHNVAIYFKKKNPDGWAEDVVRFNQDNMDPPLSNGEVQTIIKSVGRKEYGYGCNKPPINAHCNRRECIKRDFGIGGGAGNGPGSLAIDSLTKMEVRDSKTDRVINARWVLEIDGRRIEVATKDLFDQRKLQVEIAEKLSKIVTVMPGPRWERRLRDLMDNADTVQMPEDASTEGQFRILVDQFLTQHGRAKHRDELLRGQPWSDPEGGRTYFRSSDLIAYLRQRYFKAGDEQEVYSMLRHMGVEKHEFNIKGKFTRVWHVPTPPNFDESKPLEQPDFAGEQF